MNKHAPILIAGPPRVGSTLIAGLLAAHGVWIGKARVTKYPETNSLIGTENIEIKQYLKSLLNDYKNWSVPLPNVDPNIYQEFHKAILQRVYTDGPWLVKTSNILLTWQLWRRAFPSARWIFPRRNPTDIIASAMRHPAMRRRRRDTIRNFVFALLDRQEVVAKFVGANGFFINAGDLVKDRTAAWNMIDRLGIDYDDAKAAALIKPEMWHGG